jgi:carboxypeptidase C (cathepsin A)
MVVHTFLLGDWVTDQSFNIKFLLENGVKGLIYSGDKDFICNWRGGLFHTF